jgi:hypothetical protein
VIRKIGPDEGHYARAMTQQQVRTRQARTHPATKPEEPSLMAWFNPADTKLFSDPQENELVVHNVSANRLHEPAQGGLVTEVPGLQHKRKFAMQLPSDRLRVDGALEPPER